MSELRRAARSLVEPRIERVESSHGREDSERRFAAALERARITPPWPFSAAWSEADGRVALTLSFAPSPRVKLFLNLSSLVFVLLLAASAYLVMATSEGPLRFLVPLFTGLSVLGLPLVTLGMASTRDAVQARVLRAARAALKDEDEAFPPQQRWADEG